LQAVAADCEELQEMATFFVSPVQKALANEGREGEWARNIHDRFTADFALC